MSYSVRLLEDDDRMKYTISMNRVVIAKRLKEKQFDKVWNRVSTKTNFTVSDAKGYPEE